MTRQNITIYKTIHPSITDVNNIHGMAYGCEQSVICAAASAHATAITIPGYDKLSKPKENIWIMPITYSVPPSQM